MSNPRCPVCGQVNLVGATVCAVCDSRLDAPPPGAAADEPPHFDGGGPRVGALPEDVPSPRFQGAGDVIGPTLEVYRKHFAAVGLLVIITMLPVALLQFASARVTGVEPDGANASSAFGLALSGSLLAALFSAVGGALLDAALVYLVFDLQRTGQTSAGAALRRGLRVLPKVFAVNLMYGVVVAIGYLLLIVPGVIFSLMFALAVPAAVAEGRGGIDAFDRSSKLTDGYKGLIFVTFFLWGIVIMVVNMMVGWSFVHAGHQGTFAAVVTETLVGGMLNSSSAVLAVYIFLGILRERGHAAPAR
jgi:hypothetical protein